MTETLSADIREAIAVIQHYVFVPALMESAPFFTASAQLAPLWSQKYEAIKDRINTEKQRAATNAGRASIRPSTRLMG